MFSLFRIYAKSLSKCINNEYYESGNDLRTYYMDEACMRKYVFQHILF